MEITRRRKPLHKHAVPVVLVLAGLLVAAAAMTAGRGLQSADLILRSGLSPGGLAQVRQSADVSAAQLNQAGRTADLTFSIQ